MIFRRIFTVPAFNLRKESTLFMKRTCFFLIVASALIPLALHADQGATNTKPDTSSAGMQPVINDPSRPPLTRFDLHFKGGKPQKLVDAISQAMGHHINVVIPTNAADVAMPSLEMKNVTVPELFNAIRGASVETVKVVTGYYYSSGKPNEQWSTCNTYYSFETDRNTSITDDTVWYFHANRPPTSAPLPEPKLVCNFYPLANLLQDYKVEDITTAIRTGCEMLHLEHPFQMKYHPETKLLIAVGNAEDLKIIDDVLKQLESSVEPKANSDSPSASGAAKKAPSTNAPSAGTSQNKF
jgi:hypothetical protein